jgi:Flp pilus assembly protein TadG
MRNFSGFNRAVGGFARDRKGNFAVVFGVAASVLALAVGFAVDTAQLFNAKSALREAVDAAVTSTARSITLGDISEEDAPKMVKAFLTANSTGGILSFDEIVLDALTIDKVANTVEATAHVDVALYFPLFGQESTRRVSNVGAALYSDKQIEVAMMLDLTGSMEGQKIIDLRTAAKNAVDSFLGNQDPSKPRVRVSIVPYANSVNVGSLAASSVFVETKSNERKQAPGNTDPKMASAAPNPGNCATERKGDYQYSDAGPQVSMVNRDFFLSTFAKDTDTRACPAVAMMPLTADAAALKTAIDQFVEDGGTAGHIGVQWTWYMLSESWGGVMKASQRPAAVNPKKVAKYAILMTDGEFNLSYFDAQSVGQVYNSKGKEPTRTSAKKLCEAMKAKGIEIFTVGFDLNEKNAKETLGACASPDTAKVQHYYEAADGAELDSAFQSIARNIENLALTK